MGVGWKDGGWKGLVDASTTQQVVSKRKNSSEAASISIYILAASLLFFLFDTIGCGLDIVAV